MSLEPLCPKFEKTMQFLGKRWTGLIIDQLISGPKRFSELELILSITGKLLSERLKELEEEGIVERTVYPEVPIRVEYSLSIKGKELQPIMNEIHLWAAKWVNNAEHANVKE